MNEKVQIGLLNLRTTWQTQANFYAVRLWEIEGELRSQTSVFSLSYLEGEKRAVEKVLELASRTVTELTMIIQEAQDD